MKQKQNQFIPKEYEDILYNTIEVRCFACGRMRKIKYKKCKCEPNIWKRLWIFIRNKIRQFTGVNDIANYATPNRCVGYDELSKLYYNLLFAVGNKYPNESRHETALRYIVEAETRSFGTGCDAKMKKQENSIK